MKERGLLASDTLCFALLCYPILCYTQGGGTHLCDDVCRASMTFDGRPGNFYVAKVRMGASNSEPKKRIRIQEKAPNISVTSKNLFNLEQNSGGWSYR